MKGFRADLLAGRKANGKGEAWGLGSGSDSAYLELDNKSVNLDLTVKAPNFAIG